MQAPYIPAKDADFDSWLTNFSALITAAPADFGLIAADAVIIAAAQTAFNAAFVTAITPETRTSPAIAAKDAARASADATVRPYAIQIKLNAAVTDENKVAVGVNLPVTSRTPVPPPATAPVLALVEAQPGQHVLGYKDSTTPTSKAKPAGVTGIEIVRVIGVAPAVDPDQGTPLAIATKSPQRLTTSVGDVGKIATYFARWTTRSGPAGVAQRGPWSAALSVAVI